MAYIFRRVFIGIPLVFLVVSLAFLLIRLAPGSPFGNERNLDPEMEQRLLEKYTLDGSWGDQLLRYWQGLLSGDLGPSTQFRNRNVSEIISTTFPVSAALGFFSLLLALTLGSIAGTLSAFFHNQWQDRLTMAFVLSGICLPSFVLGPLLGLGFAIYWQWLPVAGWGHWEQAILPVLALGIPYGAYCSRLVRTSMIEALEHDFVRTARAKGNPEWIVVMRHAFKVGILPLVSYSGPLAAHILTGSIVIEEIFKIPGMGPFFVNSVFNRDAFMIAGCVAIYSSLLILFNLLVDVLFIYLDKRVRLS